jgi:hypothetical protein
MFPAGEWAQDYHFRGRVLSCLEIFLPQPCIEFQSSIEPTPFDGCAGSQRCGAMKPRPVFDFLDQVLLDAVREDVDQARDLGGLLFADRDRGIALSGRAPIRLSGGERGVIT